MKILKQSLESNAYSLFVYAIRSQVTRDYYLRRLRILFSEPTKNIEIFIGFNSQSITVAIY